MMVIMLIDYDDKVVYYLQRSKENLAGNRIQSKIHQEKYFKV